MLKHSQHGKSGDGRPTLFRRLHFEQCEDRRMLSVAAYPELPGLRLVDPVENQFADQLVYLDVDGEHNVSYHGPVTVEDIDVPSFAAPSSLSCQESAVLAGVLRELNDTFAGTGVAFTIEKPSDEAEYSTVYIGGTDAQFREYGSFLGLAELVDVGNIDRSDSAFAFSSQIHEDNIDSYVNRLADTVSHEIAHLIGYSHLEEYGTGPLRTVAATIESKQPYVEGTNKYKQITVEQGTTVQFIVDGVYSVNPLDDYRADWYEYPSGSPVLREQDYSFTPFYYDPVFEKTFNTVGGPFQIEADMFKNDSYTNWVIWDVTVIAPNRPPNQPSNPDPSDGETNVSINTDLDWAGSDPDGDTVYYTVYFDEGDSSPDSIIKNDATGSSATLPTLSYGKHYYWQVVADDHDGGVTQGPVWDFYTVEPDPDAYRDFPTNSSVTLPYGSSQRFTVRGEDAGGDLWKVEWTLSGPESDSDTDDIGFDGSSDTADFKDVGNYTFDTPGDYTLTARVYDDSGDSDSVSWSIHVAEQPEIKAIWWEDTLGNVLPNDSLVYVGNTVVMAVETQGMQGQQATIYLYESDDPGDDDDPRPFAITIPSNNDVGRRNWTVEWAIDTGGIDIYPEWELWRSTGLTETVHSGEIVARRKPDFTVLDILMNNQTALPSVEPGKSVSLAFDVKNLSTLEGSNSIPGIELEWYWGTSQNSTANPIDSASIAGINGLAPQEEERKHAPSWTVPTTPGQFWITAKIDPSNAVPELNELNNVLSESFIVTQPNRPPTVPGPLSASNETTEGATVNWGPSTDLDGNAITYELQYQKDDLNPFWSSTIPVDAPQTSYVLSGLDDDADYHVRVRAFDGDLRSDWNTANDLFHTQEVAVTQLSWRAGPTIDAGIVDTIETGETVYLRADATGMQGQSIDVEIWEDDGLIGGNRTATISVAIGSQGFGTIAWNAVWQAEDEDDPQNKYYAFYDVPFSVSNISSDNLQVTIPSSTPGVTVITHGWQPQFGSTELPPEWTVEMARAIAERAGDASIFVHDTRPNAATFGEWISLEGILNELTTADPLAYANYQLHNWANSNSLSDEVILIYNWAWESNDGEDGWLQAAADNLFASLLESPLGLGANVLDSMIHFIGHSRGAVLNSLVTNLVGHYYPEVTIDHVTSLDPHPIVTDGSIAGVIYEANDPNIFTYDNVRYADNYYRHDGTYQLDLDFDGVQVPDAWNLELNNYVLDEPDIFGLFDEQGSQFEHSDTHIWYLATVNTGGVTVESETISDYMQANWWRGGSDANAAYDGATEVSGRTEVGFNRTRIGGNDHSRFELGIDDGHSIVAPGYSVFNGAFDFGDTYPNEIPGWERHGGIGDADLTADGKLHLGEGGDDGEDFFLNFANLQHNPLFIPESAEFLSFEYDITRASLNDTLLVYVGDTLLDSVTLDSLRGETKLIPLNSMYRGTVDTIGFTLNFGNFIESDIYIDNVSFVGGDAQPPTVVDTTIGDGFDQRSTVKSLSVRFSEDVLVAADALQLLNQTTQHALPVGPPSYNANTFTATWNFAGLPNGKLPEGNYEAMLVADRVKDAAMNPLSPGDHPFSFHVLAGDSNGDRIVDDVDVQIVRSHYLQAGAEGDLNGDGKTNVFDLLLVQQNMGHELPPPTAEPATAPAITTAGDATLLPPTESPPVASQEIVHTATSVDTAFAELALNASPIQLQAADRAVVRPAVRHEWVQTPFVGPMLDGESMKRRQRLAERGADFVEKLAQSSTVSRDRPVRFQTELRPTVFGHRWAMLVDHIAESSDMGAAVDLGVFAKAPRKVSPQRR